MEEIEVAIDPVGKEERLAALIEEAADHYGLQVRMRGQSVEIVSFKANQYEKCPSTCSLGNLS